MAQDNEQQSLLGKLWREKPLGLKARLLVNLVASAVTPAIYAAGEIHYNNQPPSLEVIKILFALGITGWNLRSLIGFVRTRLSATTISPGSEEIPPYQPIPLSPPPPILLPSDYNETLEGRNRPEQPPPSQYRWTFGGKGDNQADEEREYGKDK